MKTVFPLNHIGKLHQINAPIAPVVDYVEIKGG